MPTLSSDTRDKTGTDDAMEQFVRDHLAETKDMPLGSFAGTRVETLLREEQKDQKKQEEQSPYSMTTAVARQRADAAQEAKDKAQREFEERLLTGEELQRFNETSELIDQNLARNDDMMGQIDGTLAQRRRDMESREIVIGNPLNQRRVLVGPDGSFVDAATDKALTDPQAIAEAHAKEKPDSATTEENQTLREQEARRDELAEQERRLRERKQEIDKGPKNHKADEEQNGLDADVKAQEQQEAELYRQVEQKRTAAVSNDQQAQINEPSVTAENPQTVSRESRGVKDYNAAHSEKRATEENRLSRLSSGNASDALHSMFATYKTAEANNQQGANSSGATTRTASYVSSQTDLRTDADAGLQKLGAQMQAAFTTGAQGVAPANLTGQTVANPTVAPSISKRPTAPAAV